MLTDSGHRGVDHIGFTVPNLDQAIDFFSGVLGARLAFRHGPYPGGTNTPRQFGRPSDSSVVEIAMLKLGSVNIELLQFDSPSASRTAPRPDEAGGHHIAFYVDDLDFAVKTAISNGIECFGTPMPLPGPESGPDARFVYLRAPWGLFVELVSYKSGKRSPAALNDARNQNHL